ncbi:MAG: GGDEF domain-containing protein [Planctomycetaceae bacterium]
MFKATGSPGLLETQELHLEARGSKAQQSFLLQVYPASSSGGLIPLSAPRVRIGRDPSLEIELLDDFASRQHAVITQTEEATLLSDCGSRNGTYVNGVRIKEQLLKEGDYVRIGNHIFKFLADDHIEAQYHRALCEMIASDVLTGALSRRAFDEAFQREMVRAVRHGRSLSLLMIDIDHFKPINDQHGHVVGDHCLSELSRRAQSVIRSDDLFGRLGGDEFAVLLAETPIDYAAVVASRVHAKITSSPFGRELGLSVQLTVSIGLAELNLEEPQTPEQLIAQADARMYFAKSAGRNQLCKFDQQPADNQVVSASDLPAMDF